MSAERPLRLGTRRSRLAVTQSGWVADLLRARGHQVELVEIVTEGDVNRAPLTQIGGTGVFASALRGALLAGEVDFAVHSLKDLPVAPEPGLVVAAVPQREDVRDALVTRDGATLRALPAGSVVGTGSPRRAAQLAGLRPDLVVRPLRGNVDSRLGRVHSGELDAVILAGAGLRRLGLQDEISELLSLDDMLPAPGQGALAVECREDRDDVARVLAELEDEATRVAVRAERALLADLEAGCTAPIGAHAELDADGGLELTAFAGSDDGSIALRHTVPGRADDPLAAGRECAAWLLSHGADRIGETVRARHTEPGPVVLPEGTGDDAASTSTAGRE